MTNQTSSTTDSSRSGIAYGYARVSSVDQNEDRQLISLHQAGVPDSHIFVDHKSGKDFNRPAWKKLLRKLRSGDLLIITSLDRLGRNYEEMQEIWRKLTKQQGIKVRVLDMPLLNLTKSSNLTEGFIADIFLQILAYVAQMEREHIHARQKEGIAAARRRGVKFGRPKVLIPKNFHELVMRVKNSELSINQASRRCGLSITTFWRRMNEIYK